LASSIRDDVDVAGALFDRAEAWLKAREEVMRAPELLHLHSVGFEVEGARTCPLWPVPLRPVLPGLADACGFPKCIDWYCFLVKKADYDVYAPYLQAVKRPAGQDRVHFRWLDRGT
jgi:hypothetical protein